MRTHRPTLLTETVHELAHTFDRAYSLRYTNIKMDGSLTQDGAGHKMQGVLSHMGGLLTACYYNC